MCEIDLSGPVYQFWPENHGASKNLAVGSNRNYLYCQYGLKTLTGLSRMSKTKVGVHFLRPKIPVLARKPQCLKESRGRLK